MMQHLQEQQQPSMHLQPPSYHRDPHQYTPEQAHAVQLIQLGSMPQYYYQEPQQPYSHPLYQQSHLSQHLQREDSQLKTYSSDRQTPALLSSHGDMGPSDTGVADPASSEMTRVTSTLPHQPLLSPSGIHLNNMGSQHQQPSPSAMWTQMHLPDGRAQPGSPESSGQTKGVFGEQFDAKNKLTCSICLKEFKSLPALNGHMRSHGGMRASPSLKQVSRGPPRPLQVMCCLLCFAALGVRQGDGCVPFVGARRGGLHFPGFLDKYQKRSARNLVGILSLFLEKGTKELCQCEIYKYANADYIHMQMCS